MSEEADCPICEGDGRVEDPVTGEVRSLCPVCAPTHPPIALPGALHSLHYRTVEARWQGPLFRVGPDLIVLHRGVHDADISRYFALPSDGRKVSAHYVVEPSGDIVQCVALTRVAYHAAGVNLRSYGIEMRGPMDSEFDERMLDSVHALCAALVLAVPSLTRICGHSAISPHRRRDPGAGFPWECYVDLGLESPHFSRLAGRLVG